MGCLWQFVSLGFGILFTIRVGGADMPIYHFPAQTPFSGCGPVRLQACPSTILLLVVVGAVVGCFWVDLNSDYVPGHEPQPLADSPWQDHCGGEDNCANGF